MKITKNQYFLKITANYMRWVIFNYRLLCFTYSTVVPDGLYRQDHYQMNQVHQVFQCSHQV